MNHKLWIKSVILATSSLTVMSGAIIAPALPAINAFFENESEVLVKLVLTMPALSIALLASTAGRLVDKVGRKRVLLISLALYALAGSAGFYLTNLYVLLFSRILLGAAVAGAMNAATTLIGDYFDGQERNRFMGMQASFMALGGVVFLNAGGALADLSWHGPFLAYLFSVIIFPFAFRYLYEPEKASPNPGEETQAHSPSLVYFIYLMGFLAMLFFYFVPVQVPFLLEKHTDVSNTLIGMAISVSTVTGAIVSVNYGNIKARLSHAKIYMMSFLLVGVGFLILSFSTTYFAALVGLAMTGLGTGVILPNGSLWLTQLSDASTRGKLIGGLTAAIFAGQFISPLISSPLVAATSLNTSFFIASIMAFGMILLPYMTEKKYSRMNHLGNI